MKQSCQQIKQAALQGKNVEENESRHPVSFSGIVQDRDIRSDKSSVEAHNNLK